MRAVIQRVKAASVIVNGDVIAKIGPGIFVLLGIGKEDNEEDIIWLANKIINLRIFENDNGRFNYSLLDVNGELLLVSQFTLYADCKKGRRPSFDNVMPPQDAKIIFDKFCNYLKTQNIKIQTGVFGAKMEIELINYGPVTIYLDSQER